MIVQISAKRYYNGTINNVDYLGNYQPDGYVYFNDNTFYRCRPDGIIQQGTPVNGTDIQLCYMSKEQWVRCGTIRDIKMSLFTTGVAGGSSTALISLARSELGNTGAKYWNWYSQNVTPLGPYVNGNVTPYCAIFLSWLLGQTGVTCIGFPRTAAFGYGDSNIPASARIMAANLTTGDFVSFDWDNDNVADHVGLVIGNDGTTIHTIEGNTGGGYVTERYRDYTTILFGLRPNYL